jgi:hypothetical protein
VRQSLNALYNHSLPFPGFSRAVQAQLRRLNKDPMVTFTPPFRVVKKCGRGGGRPPLFPKNLWHGRPAAPVLPALFLVIYFGPVLVRVARTTHTL